MDIAKIDKNFKAETINKTDIRWWNIREEGFDTRGIFYAENEGLYRRLPREIADSVSEGVAWLSTHTAGGRVRFSTDSEYVAFKAFVPNVPIMSHMPCLGQCGFSVYQEGVFIGSIQPPVAIFKSGAPNTLTFEGIVYLKGKGEKTVDIYFPLYNGVKELYLGLQENAVIRAAKPYDYEKPFVFYGSSITQGGCASRPGNDYVAMCARWLNADFVNLGFSGSAKGEETMAEYLATFDAEVFVMDYDWNAPSAEWLKQTHFRMYEKIRAKHPTMPIVFMTRPDVLYYPDATAPRRKVIYNHYLKAKRQGDKNVYYINGESLFGHEDWHSCTMDCCHPNDLGFYRMAKTVYKKLKSILQKEN